MSKSRGNAVDPWEVIGEFGADTVRLYLLASSQVWLPKRFDAEQIPETAGKFFNALRNTYAFFAQYAGDWTPPEGGLHAGGLHAGGGALADRWVLSRLDATVAAVEAAWSGYDVTAGTRAVMDFVVEDLSQWYVRTNRARFWAPDRTADPAALATLHHCLVVVSRLLAPAAPFASDWLHRSLTGTSVHLAAFPQVGPWRDPALEGAMDAVRRLASLARAAREEGNLRVRQPLAAMQVAVPAALRGPALDDLLALLRLEVNVRRVEIATSDTELVRLRARANFRTLGKRYGKRTPEVAAAAARLAPAQLRALEEGTPAVLALEDGTEVSYLPEDVVVEREVATEWLVQSSGPYVVALDPRLDDALRREGLAREIVNRVQRLRKEAGYAFTTRIALRVEGDAEVLEAVRAHAAEIQAETLARRLELGAQGAAGDGFGDADLRQDVVVEGYAARLGVRRHEPAAGGTGPGFNEVHEGRGDG
jgi:isoleucyl-tRNA synthetase